MTTAVAEEVRAPARLAALRRSGLLRPGSASHLDRVADLAASLIDAPIALISMVDEDRQYFTSARGLADPWASQRQTPLSHSICQRVVATHAPVVIHDMGVDPDDARHPARSDMGVEAYCGVPIRDPDGMVLGSLCVIDDRPHRWRGDTVEVLRQLAGVITDAIASNHAYAELVLDLQQRLLPAWLPQPANGRLAAMYRPVPDTGLTGGDFYDALQRDDGGVDVVLGDVVGHGVASTQAAAQLRAAARAVLAGGEGSPAELINHIAEACADLPGCDTAALTVLRIGADGRQVRWARAGAMPPVLLGSQIRVLRGGASPPIGVAECVPSDDCEMVLEHGEGMLLFTDGLVERRGEDIDVGLDRLVAAASWAADLDRLIEAACPTPAQGDDIAVVRLDAHR